jgi:hypothetical protein
MDDVYDDIAPKPWFAAKGSEKKLLRDSVGMEPQPAG